MPTSTNKIFTILFISRAPSLTFTLEEEPKYALDTYNALNGTNYTDKSAIIIQKLDGRVMLSMRNDASFLLDSFFNLYEHQSTYNPNMPLRQLLYFSDLVGDMIKTGNLNVYGSRRIPIPTPKFVVFYNGRVARPEQEVMCLSDLYEHKLETYDLDLTCVVYNINPGCNEAIKAKSEALRGYTMFVEKVRQYSDVETTLEDAINRAIDECIEAGVLVDFFTRRREEVLKMEMLDFTFERQLQLEARDSRNEGRMEGEAVGHKKGWMEGEAAGIRRGEENAICRLLTRGKTVEEICDLMGYPMEEILQVEQQMLAGARTS